jgi:hypothetical protein
VIFLLCVTVASVQAHPQTATQAETPKATPKALGPVPAPIKSRALLAAEKRIADLELELQRTNAYSDEMEKIGGEVMDKWQKTIDQLGAEEAELKPLEKMMADISAIAKPVSENASEETRRRDSVILILNPEGGLLWPAKKPNGETTWVVMNPPRDPKDSVSVKDMVDAGWQSELTVGAWDESNQRDEDRYNELLDRYNGALANAKKMDGLLVELIASMSKANAAEPTHERWRDIGLALALGLSKFETYTPPPVYTPPPIFQPSVHCTSLAIIPQIVTTNCY